MPKVLLVTNTFPPLAGNSSEKMATRVRHLFNNGWEVKVLTPQLAAGDQLDEDLLRGLTEIEVIRTPFLFQKKFPSLKKTRGLFLTGQKKSAWDFLYIPNGYIRWLPYAIRTGMRLAKDVDLVLSFNNPTMMHLIGYVISRVAQKPWVAGLRDPICGNPIHRRGPELFNSFIENLVAHKAERVVQWGDFVAIPMSRRYFQLPDERFVVIPFTGYNPDDFLETDLTPREQVKPLRLAYTGSFYPGSISPEPLLKALGTLLFNGQIKKNDLQISFAGDWDTSYNEIIVRYGLEDVVHYLGYLTRQECLELWKASHVLIVILGENFDSIDRFPAKFWDYVGANRYILALVPVTGKLAKLVQEQRLGVVAPPHNETELAKVLVRLIDDFQISSLIPQPTERFYKQDANRAFSEKQFADVLDKVFFMGLIEKPLT